MKLDAALAIFYCFKGQATEDFYKLLEKHNIRYILVPANGIQCRDWSAWVA